MTAKNLKRASLAATAAALAFGAASASAYSLTFQNVTFSTTAVDSDTLQLRIFNADNATGDWTGITSIGAFGLKQGDSNFTDGTVTPYGGSFSSLELSANGCSGGDNGNACFTFDPKLALTHDMIFTIDLTASNSFDTAGVWHLMVNFFGTECGSGRYHDGKCGSLLSMDVTNVPEPGTLSLLGLGLLGVGFMRRRAKQAD